MSGTFCAKHPEAESLAKGTGHLFPAPDDRTTMHLPNRLRDRFADALQGLIDDPSPLAGMIRPTADPKFGDYQSNCAMPLAKQLGDGNPRQVAEQVLRRLDLDSICEPPQIAGPGFINLKLRDSFLCTQLRRMLEDPRCLVETVSQPRRIVIDYSSPNVAKPMHVGHIRSTVIGDSLARVLRFLGHEVITDNHLGDWGTQFGIIIYAFKHFGDPEVVSRDPVPELAKLYRLANQLIEYHKAVAAVSKLRQQRRELAQTLQQVQTSTPSNDPKEAKREAKEQRGLQRRMGTLDSELEAAAAKIAAVEHDPELKALAAAHGDIERAVLAETAKLHAGDPENLELWKRFLPYCQDETDRIYRRLDIHFDHTLGESFYHPMLPEVVRELQQRGLATESDGALCVFLPGFDAPMIVRKQDGAYLYATTDLATLLYRQREFAPDEILYVVDSRQSEHFDKLFAVAQQLGLEQIKFVHVKFGTVLGEDGRPMKTRSGSLVGLESLLDDAVDRARQVVCNPERLQQLDPPMSREEQESIAEAVGIGAIKFADLSHHRASDYRFILDKMVALDGNTATYIQYSYARTEGILRKAGTDAGQLMRLLDEQGVGFCHPAERALALLLLRLEEVLVAVHQDYTPNQLADYLYETAKAYAVFNDHCPVLKAETEQARGTRLLLVTLCGRILRTGLSLLGVQVIQRM